MDTKKQQKLFDKYPAIFQDKDKPMSQTCMCWGIDVGNGWYNIVKRICEMLDDIYYKTGVLFVADQVKEKYGTLRFYYHDEGRLTKISKEERLQLYNKVSNFIGKMEKMSGTICEECGKPGNLRSRGWIITLCDKCSKKMGRG